MWSPYRPTANFLALGHGFVLFWRLCDTGTVTKRVHRARSVGRSVQCTVALFSVRFLQFHAKSLTRKNARKLAIIFVSGVR